MRADLRWKNAGLHHEEWDFEILTSIWLNLDGLIQQNLTWSKWFFMGRGPRLHLVLWKTAWTGNPPTLGNGAVNGLHVDECLNPGHPTAGRGAIFVAEFLGISDLVGGLEHLDYFSISYMGCHPSHWRTPSFFKMVKTTNQWSVAHSLPFWLLNFWFVSLNFPWKTSELDEEQICRKTRRQTRCKQAPPSCNCWFLKAIQL